MTNVFSLKNKVGIITGGSSGIGFGIARQFVANGAKIIIIGRSLEKLKSAQLELGKNCLIYQEDITNKSVHIDLVRKVETEIGGLNILVNNAGIHQKMPSFDVTDENFQEVMDINLNSVFSLTREALKSMVPRGEGSIINICSMSAIYGLPQVVSYSSSKAALLGLTRSLAVEYSFSGVRINAIAPGFIESEMLNSVMDTDPERKKKVLERTPMRRLGKSNEIGYAATFLASDASKFITGICLPVDGGNSIGF